MPGPTEPAHVALVGAFVRAFVGAGPATATDAMSMSTATTGPISYCNSALYVP